MKELQGDPNQTYVFVNRQQPIKCVKTAEDIYQVSGSLISFKKDSSDTNDYVGDYFTKLETDYGQRTDSPVYYQHLQDGFIKSIPLMPGFAPMKSTDVDVWIDAQINLSKSYAQAISNKYGIAVDDYIEAMKGIVKMAEVGLLGWSSGTAGHTMKSIQMPDGNRITQWHLGLDASLTPNPAEYKTVPALNKVMPLKNLSDFLNTGKIEISSHLPNIKAGKEISNNNLGKLNDIRDQLNSFLDGVNVNSGNNALTDNAPEAEGFNMNGEKTKVMDDKNMNKTSCDSCSDKKVKFAEIKERIKTINTPELKALIEDKYDASWILYDISDVLYVNPEFLDTSAIANALRDVADFVEEMNTTKNVDVSTQTNDSEDSTEVDETDSNSNDENSSDEITDEGLSVKSMLAGFQE